VVIKLPPIRRKASFLTCKYANAGVTPSELLVLVSHLLASLYLEVSRGSGAFVAGAVASLYGLMIVSRIFTV